MIFYVIKLYFIIYFSEKMVAAAFPVAKLGFLLIKQVL